MRRGRIASTVTTVVAFLAFACTCGAAEPPAAGPTSPAAAAGADRPLTPVSVFEKKDFPEPEPGKPAWAPIGLCSQGICVFDKWVYAASSHGGCILLFECDPATAKLEYKSATPFGVTLGAARLANTSMISCLFVRKLPDDSALLYIEFSAHAPALRAWYTLDKKTGKLTFKGKQEGKQEGDGTRVLHYLPATDRVYGPYGPNEGRDALGWMHFDETGAAVEDGTVRSHGGGDGGWFYVSPDGRAIYTVVGGHKKGDGDFFDPMGAVEVYTCDVKTGKPTYRASVNVPASGIMPIPPDGRHLYVFGDPVRGPDRGAVLARDPENGMLAVVGSVEPAARFSGLGGGEWSRQNRLEFNGDGKSGCFLSSSVGFGYAGGDVLGTFTRDPATGALTVGATASARQMGAVRVTMDPATGHFFTVGEKIASFKSRGPYVDKTVVANDNVTFVFKQAEGGLSVKDSPDGVIQGLTITDASGDSKPLKASREGTSLIADLKGAAFPVKISYTGAGNLVAKGEPLAAFEWKTPCLRVVQCQGNTMVLSLDRWVNDDIDVWKAEKSYIVSGATVTKVEVDGKTNNTVCLTTDKTWKIGDKATIKYPAVPAELPGVTAELAFTVMSGQVVGEAMLKEFLIGEVRETIDPKNAFDQDTLDKNIRPVAGEKWKLCGKEEKEAYGVHEIDLTKHVGPQGNALAHVCTYVYSDVNRKVQLWAGSRYGIQIVVNGKVVNTDPATHNGGFCTMDLPKVRDVELNKGWNTVLLGIPNGKNGCGFNLCIRNEQGGGPPAGLRYTAELPSDK